MQMPMKCKALETRIHVDVERIDLHIKLLLILIYTWFTSRMFVFDASSLVVCAIPVMRKKIACKWISYKQELNGDKQRAKCILVWDFSCVIFVS